MIGQADTSQSRAAKRTSLPTDARAAGMDPGSPAAEGPGRRSSSHGRTATKPSTPVERHRKPATRELPLKLATAAVWRRAGASPSRCSDWPGTVASGSAGRPRLPPCRAVPYRVPGRRRACGADRCSSTTTSHSTSLLPHSDDKAHARPCSTAAIGAPTALNRRLGLPEGTQGGSVRQMGTEPTLEARPRSRCPHCARTAPEPNGSCTVLDRQTWTGANPVTTELDPLPREVRGAGLSLARTSITRARARQGTRNPAGARCHRTSSSLRP